MHKSILELDFERHPVRKQSVSWIELHFPNGQTMPIKPSAPCRGIRRGNDRPHGFTWHNPGAIKVTPALFDWLHTEFRWIFSYDAFLWAISIQSAPAQLHHTLQEFTP